MGAALVAAGTAVNRMARSRRMLAGEVAMITGASRGFGFLLARELGRRGCRLVICARNEAELERARADLASEGMEVLAVVCDVGDRVQVEHMIQQARERFGRIDILVNNAGIIQVGPMEEANLEDYHEAMDAMYWGVVHPTLATLPDMRARRHGHIVTITSIGGKTSVPHLLPYSSAKFAAVGFSEGLGAELAGSGVRVTTIVPGLMRTGSYFNALFQGQAKKEAGIFSLGATAPILSMDAERAARQVVDALERGEAVRVLGMPARLLMWFHGLFPGVTVRALGLVDRVLPSPDGGGEARGEEALRELDSDALRAATTMGRTAARRFHETPSPPEAGESRWGRA